VLFGSQPFTSALVMSNPKWFRYELAWDKHTPTGFFNADKMPMKSHENILIFGDGSGVYNPQKTLKPYKGARTGDGFTKVGTPAPKTKVYGDTLQGSGYRSEYAHPKTVISFPTGNGWAKKNHAHPTQKPLALLEYLVKTYTNEGDAVLDFTFGSGTTGAACGNLGRRFIGIEKDAEYFRLGSERIATAYAPLRAMQVAV
jgi:hypothetical protein